MLFEAACWLLALSWTLQAVELYRVHTPHYYLITVYCLNLYLLPHKTRHALKGGEDISRNEIKRPHSIVLDVLLQIANISKKEKFAMHIHTLHSYKWKLLDSSAGNKVRTPLCDTSTIVDVIGGGIFWVFESLRLLFFYKIPWLTFSILSSMSSSILRAISWRFRWYEWYLGS